MIRWIVHVQDQRTCGRQVTECSEEGSSFTLRILFICGTPTLVLRSTAGTRIQTLDITAHCWHIYDCAGSTAAPHLWPPVNRVQPSALKAHEWRKFAQVLICDAMGMAEVRMSCYLIVC